MLKNCKLLNFHRKCKKEYTELIKAFNILFYGFGCKKELLMELFPGALLYDMYYYTIKDIIADLNDKFDMEKATVKEIDEAMSEKECNTILIFVDFDFALSNLLKNLSHFRIILTLEKIDTVITEDDLKDLDLVMRDLTTYKSYDVDNLMVCKTNIEDYLNVIRNVNKNSKFVLSTLLSIKQESVPVNELWKKICRPLLLVDRNAMMRLMTEFLDHKLIRIDDEQNIRVLVEAQYWDSLVNECNG